MLGSTAAKCSQSSRLRPFLAPYISSIAATCQAAQSLANPASKRVVCAQFRHICALSSESMYGRHHPRGTRARARVGQGSRCLGCRCQGPSCRRTYRSRLVQCWHHRFCDRDMFMRYLGGGIGHQMTGVAGSLLVSRPTHDTLYASEDPMVEDEEDADADIDMAECNPELS
ncbi:hypothetical protein C2E23DRAFT_557623 [Lenzites betulinus]|nr:hypothetical protein C2E23DRAFT_557623 [Lenzites betulinus]